MSHKNRILAELHKLRHYNLSCGCIHYHVIADAGKLLNSVGNGNLRIDKLREPVHYLSVFDLNGTNLNDPVLDRRKTCSLNIKYYKGSIIKALPLVVYNNLLQVINYVGLNTQNQFKEILAVYRRLTCLFPSALDRKSVV